MRYLLDKNILSNHLLKNESSRDDLCVLEEVVNEFSLPLFELSRLKGNGIIVLSISKKHLEKLKEVLSMHGDNLQLINLYSCKGTADVTMIAFILAELSSPESLFIDEYTIVTKDKALINVAKFYGINCVTEI